MKKIDDLEQSKQGLETIKIIVWMFIAVMFTASIVISTLSILRITNPLANALTVVIAISLVSTVVFLKNSTIIKLMSLLSIIVLALALVV